MLLACVKTAIVNGCIVDIRQNKRGESGFTLVEAMVVVVIVGVLATVAVASYRTWFVKNRVNGAISQLYSEMHLAKMRSISENSTYRITFDTVNHAYTVFAGGTTDHTVSIGDNYEGIEFDYVPGTLKAGGSALITKAVNFTGTPPSILFRPTGLSKAGSVYLKPGTDNRENMQRAIVVNIVGRIDKWKHNGTSWEY